MESRKVFIRYYPEYAELQGVSTINTVMCFSPTFSNVTYSHPCSSHFPIFQNGSRAMRNLFSLILVPDPELSRNRLHK